MKINKPREQAFSSSEIYYVTSESGGDKHIVVHSGLEYFCDCKDFMTRRLPLFRTSGFSLCKHGQFVRDGKPSKKPKSAKRYGIYLTEGTRSNSVPGIFKSQEAAQKAINNFRYLLGRMVQVIDAE